MCGRGPALWLTTPLPVWGRVHVGSTARPGSPERAVPAGGAPPRLSPLRLRFRDRPRHCPQVLWPYLLEFVTPVRFTGALTPLCRSLMHLAQKRQEAAPGALLIQYDGNVTLPSPYAIATRLLVSSVAPRSALASDSRRRGAGSPHRGLGAPILALSRRKGRRLASRGGRR